MKDESDIHCISAGETIPNNRTGCSFHWLRRSNYRQH